MLYMPKTASATAPAVMLSGRNIAHSRRSIPHRSFIGAALHFNHYGITSPTVKQCAAIVGVCVPYVAAAIAVSDDAEAAWVPYSPASLTSSMRPSAQLRARVLLTTSVVHHRPSWPPLQRRPALI